MINILEDPYPNRLYRLEEIHTRLKHTNKTKPLENRVSLFFKC
jgi:hypothetical protein